MRLSIPAHVQLRLTGGAIALLVAVGCFTSAARAGCGDHVFTRTTHSPALSKATPPLPKPCTGPHCSNHPAPTPFAPVTVPTPPQWAALALPALAGLPGLSAALAEPWNVAASHYVADVFHPPR